MGQYNWWVIVPAVLIGVPVVSYILLVVCYVSKNSRRPGTPNRR